MGPSQVSFAGRGAVFAVWKVVRRSAGLCSIGHIWKIPQKQIGSIETICFKYPIEADVSCDDRAAVCSSNKVFE